MLCLFRDAFDESGWISSTARAILIDLEDRNVGQSVFARFTGGREGTLAYYQSLANIFSKRNVPVSTQLESVVGRMHQLAGNAVREPLHVAASVRSA